jgi:hypothetical protein
MASTVNAGTTPTSPTWTAGRGEWEGAGGSPGGLGRRAASESVEGAGRGAEGGVEGERAMLLARQKAREG